MDFRSLIQKIESIDGVVETPKAPVLPKSLQLNEDAQLRVLSGRTTYVAEANKKAEEDKKVEDKKEVAKSKEKDKKKSEGVESSGDKLNEYQSKDGVYKHKGTRGADYDGSDHEDKPSKAAKSSKEKEGDRASDKAEEKKGKDWEKTHGKGSVTRVKDGKKVESIDTDVFRSKFAQMVEAVKKDEKKIKGKKANEKMDEAKKPDDDNDGVPNWADKKPGEDDNADKKKSGKKGMSAKQAKFFGKKKTVKESVEFGALSFKDMLQLVQESGGQQQIDPLDKTLFSWAERVAHSKFQESRKAEVYAGLVYERMGGKFELYDVLSEGKKKINEGRVQLTEGMIDKIKNVLMSKLAPKLSDDEKSKMKSVAQDVLGKSEVSSSDFTLDNIKAISKALGAKPEAASESIEEGPMDMIKDAGKKVSDFFGQKKVDPKSGMGTIGGIDAYHKDATLGEKLVSLTGALGGTAATIAGFFGGPAWLIIPGILALMIMSQVGLTKD